MTLDQVLTYRVVQNKLNTFFKVIFSSIQLIYLNIFTKWYCGRMWWKWHANWCWNSEMKVFNSQKPFYGDLLDVLYYAVNAPPQLNRCSSCGSCTQKPVCPHLTHKWVTGHHTDKLTHLSVWWLIFVLMSQMTHTGFCVWTTRNVVTFMKTKCIVYE